MAEQGSLITDIRPLPKILDFFRRLFSSFVVLLAIIYLSLFGLSMARGQRVGLALENALRDSVSYLARVLQGDLGGSTSFLGGGRTIAVGEVLPTMLVNSLGLLGVSLLLAMTFGLALGALAARSRRSSSSLLPLTLSLVGMSLPSFLTALLLQLAIIFAVRNWGIKPLPVGGFGWDARLVLPALVLAARPIAQISRVTAITLTEVLDTDFVRTARAKGLPGRLLFPKHVIPHIAIPVFTTFGSSLRFSLSSLPVVELFFGWPGAGFSLLRSISRQDDALTIGLVVSLGGIFILVNWALDLMNGRLDPRVREGNSAQPQEKPSLFQELGDTLSDWVCMARHSRLVRWLCGKRKDIATNGDDDLRLRRLYQEIVKERVENGASLEIDELTRRRERLRAWHGATLLNPPFIVGAIILLSLLFVVILGPSLAPKNPYQLTTLQMIDGRIAAPPFPPSVEYPWGSDVVGRDVMSLVLTGAGRTLSLAAIVVLARLLVGLILGALAGWRAGGVIDRAILGLSETLAAFPALLLAMILILAIGIRQGASVFVIALCVIGWGDVMLFVRAEVKTIKPMTYIEGAVAVGLRSPRIILSHVLPNLVSPLIALAALEMGATLMLLGELGFIGIFIGGGALVELAAMMPPFHYSDVPEWGAMLSNMRLYARSYPWTALYPALAFFIAILGFNYFGEGLRLMIERVGVGFTRLVNRYTLAGALALFLAFSWVRENVGPWNFLLQEAHAFQAQRALEDIEYLAGEELDGRLVGTEGMYSAAAYIASQFETAGLNPGGTEMSYFHVQPRSYATYLERPALSLKRSDGTWYDLEYGQDFVAFQSHHYTSGAGDGEVVFLAVGKSETRYTYAGGLSYPHLESRIDLQDAFLLMTQDMFLETSQVDLRIAAGRGILIIAESDEELATYRIPAGHRMSVLSERGEQASAKPMFLISRSLASRLVALSGQDLGRLEQGMRQLGQDEILTVRTGAVVKGSVYSELHSQAPAVDVIATFPGLNDAHDHELILVMAPYDGLGRDPNGGLLASANSTASPVAVMLEIIRSWIENGYQPDRTFMFVAYTSGGQPYGKEPDTPIDPASFPDVRYAYRGAFDLQAIVQLGPLGGGAGSRLQLWTGGNQRLGDLFARAARAMDVRTRRSQDDLDIGLLFTSNAMSPGRRVASASSQKAPTIGIRWEGGESPAGTISDSIGYIDIGKLERAGRTLSLALMTMGKVSMQ